MRKAVSLRAVAGLLLIFALAVPASDLMAQRPQRRAGAAPQLEGKPDPAAAKKAEGIKEESSVTQHTVRINGREIAYTATAGTLLLKEEDGKKKATVFYVAYTKDGEDASKRPVTFTFNGGPGSSSVWLHLGAFGPKRVPMTPEGFAPPPPYRMVENQGSLIDVTDLVFIDPVTTGYSRAVPGESDKQFHGLQEDIQSVAEFIRLWTVRNKRWPSPKFLAGESYGTTRAAGLSGYLQQRHGMYLNGIVLVSAILNFQTARFGPGNDLPPILFLPTYTAIAWYHQRLPADLQQSLEKAVNEARAFARGEYASALMKGDRLAGVEKQQIAAKLARLTGLSPEYIEQTNLRINIMRFTKELLRDQRSTVGRLDGRFTGIDIDAAGERMEFDPSMAAIMGPYTGTLNDYVRRELKFESDLPYEILSGRVRPWSYARNQNSYVNVAETLRSAMTQNRNLKVHVANGYFDLATPFFATEYTFDHLGLDPSLRGNISMSYYEAGHMMYIRETDLLGLAKNVRAFIRSAVSQ